MEIKSIDEIIFLTSWKEKFLDLVTIIQEDFKAFLGKRNIQHYYLLEEDAAQKKLVLRFIPVNMLPKIIVKRLQLAFVQARPKQR